jgi:hypothetical protein
MHTHVSMAVALQCPGLGFLSFCCFAVHQAVRMQVHMLVVEVTATRQSCAIRQFALMCVSRELLILSSP